MIKKYDIRDRKFLLVQPVACAHITTVDSIRTDGVTCYRAKYLYVPTLHPYFALLNQPLCQPPPPPPFLPSYRTASPASHRPCRVREVNVHCACLRCPGTHCKLSPRHVSCLSPPRRFKIPTKKEKKKEKGTAAVSPPTCPQKHPR